jgi:hypothetical protein
MQEQLPSSINHFQHTLNSYKTHHNGIFKNALSLMRCSIKNLCCMFGMLFVDLTPQTEKLSPQPQVPFTFGLLNWKASLMPSLR